MRVLTHRQIHLQHANLSKDAFWQSSLQCQDCTIVVSSAVPLKQKQVCDRIPLISLTSLFYHSLHFCLQKLPSPRADSLEWGTVQTSQEAHAPLSVLGRTSIFILTTLMLQFLCRRLSVTTFQSQQVLGKAVRKKDCSFTEVWLTVSIQVVFPSHWECSNFQFNGDWCSLVAMVADDRQEVCHPGTTEGFPFPASSVCTGRRRLSVLFAPGTSMAFSG